MNPPTFTTTQVYVLNRMRLEQGSILLKDTALANQNFVALVNRGYVVVKDAYCGRHRKMAVLTEASTIALSTVLSFLPRYIPDTVSPKE